MKLSISALLVSLLSTHLLIGQNTPIITEAESGTRGAEWSVTSSTGVQYVTIQTDLTTVTNGGQVPGKVERTVSFTVNFPAAGSYELYARVRVGANPANDDSFFYGNGFGTKNVNEANDWVIVNQLEAVGFALADDYVSGLGGAQSGVWKWLNLSENNRGEDPVTFIVPDGNLTQTFQIGAREDGLDIDKVAFAPAAIFYTVSNLDNGEAGVDELPDPNEIPPIADGQDKFLGNIYSNSQLENFTSYWNQVAPENAGKWGSVEGTRDVMNWAALDNAYNLAKDNDFPFRMHVLVWGNQQPAWIESLSSAEQLEEIEEWFSLVAARYPDIDIIEVVNEPLHDPPNQSGNGGGNYINALGGSGAQGSKQEWIWVLTAFRLAREHFPDTKLMINDYNIVNSSTNTIRYKTLIDTLLSENLLDAIGVQAHAFSLNTTESSVITSNLNTLASANLPLYVTEMDIDGPTDAVHLERYRRIFPLFWEHPAVAGITLWGYRPGMWRTDQMAYLINADGSERPSMVWLRGYVDGTFVDTNTITVSASGGNAEISTPDGTLQMNAAVLPADVTLPGVIWSVSNAGLATISSTGVLTALNDGTVTVTATAIDGSGVKGTLNVTLSNQVVTDITDVELLNLYPYPNPVIAGKISVQGTDRVRQIKVIDMSGRSIREITLLNEPMVDIELFNAAPGVYAIQFFGERQSVVKKVVVK